MLLMWVTPIFGQDDAANPVDYTLRRVRVPILMYHYMGEIPPGADPYRVGLTVEPEVFRTHLEYLRDNGYTTITFYDLDAALTQGAALPEKPVILTFDDGYADHYTQAFPMLQSFGMTGTFFVITARIDNGDPNHLTWPQVEAMQAAGMEIEAHTKTHVDLRNRSYEQLVYEILGSIESVAAYTGRRPGVFSYPAGQYDATTLQVVENASILRAVTTQPGTLHTTNNRFELRRLRVQGNMSAVGIAYLLGQ